MHLRAYKWKEMTMTDIKRVALITGCGENGIGAATAKRLASEGVIVVVTDVAAAGADNDNTLQREGGNWQGWTLTSRIEDAGGEAMSLVGDVSNEVDAQALVLHSSLVAWTSSLTTRARHGQDRGNVEDVPVRVAGL